MKVGAIAAGRSHVIAALPYDGCQTLIGRGVCVRQSGFYGLRLPFTDTHILFAERPTSASAQGGNCQQCGRQEDEAVQWIIFHKW